MADARPCEHCRQPFTPSPVRGGGHNARFCSEQCRKAARSWRRRTERDALRAALDRLRPFAAEPFQQELREAMRLTSRVREHLVAAGLTEAMTTESQLANLIATWQLRVQEASRG